jgi:ABC-type amino acid transport substrate-binding protein
VVKDSPAIMRIKNMIAEIGDTIYINMLEKYGAEQLLALVAYGDIDYAVCDRNIAQLAADSLPQLDLSIPIGFTQFYAWGVNKQSPILLDSINAWLERYQKTETYKALAKKYNVN